MSEFVRMEREGAIAILVLDVPGEPVNTLSPKFSNAFAQAIAQVESDSSIAAAIVISGKKDNFIAGADIKVLETVRSADDGVALSKQGQAALQRLATLSKPLVAAIHGACLGGGLEVALACHYRVATDDKKTKLGLPEVQLGLLPGAGGTQRLPKLIGIAAALDLILTGKQLNAKRAKAVGLVDVVCPTPLLRQAAIEAAQRLIKRAEARTWSERAHARSGANQPSPLAVATAWFKALPSQVTKKQLTELVLEDNPLGRKVLFDQALKQLRSKTGGHYPAPEKALEAVRIGAAHDFADDGPGYAAEAAGFGELLMSPQSKQLINIFFATTALKKDNGCDDPLVQARSVNQITMLGAGLMGAGIAYVSANAGLNVRLKDRDAASVGKGLAYARQILDERVRKRRSTPRDRSDIMARISPTTDYAGLRDSQVIIEAVFEDIDLKHRIVREVESACSPTAIFASNTSTIPLTTIARASARPGQVIGMHYFSPVQKMPLLEIIVTEQTEPWVVATCVELGKRHGKTVIVVNDGVGFYTSRILGPYMNEAFHVLSQGVAVQAIDKALTDFGYPVGPVKLLDEVGIDVAHKAAAVVQGAFGERLDSPPGIEALIADNRQGRKNGRGFYLYPSEPTTGRGRKADTGGREVDASVYRTLGITSTTTMPAEQIATRCWLQMVNEAAHCFGEGVLRSARDGDIGAMFGLGFPPFRGGPFRFADNYGIYALVAELQRHQQLYGKRFAPAPVLVDMATRQQTFYPSPTGALPNLAQPGHHGTPPLG